jgi:LuxR family maltose regulon positive regulatory protein
LLAQIHYEWNQLYQAEALVQTSLTQAWTPVEAAALDVLWARIAAARGQAYEADEHLAQRESFAAGRVAREILAAWRVRLWLSSNRLPEHRIAALGWANRPGLSQPGLSDATRDLLALTQVRVWLAYGETRSALRVLAEVREAAQAAGRMLIEVECDVLEALARQQLRQRSRAFESIWRALSLAEPEGLVRTFADEGPAVAHLLRRVPSHQPGTLAAGPSAAYIDTLLLACDPTPNAAPLPAAGLLTTRELDVLRGVAQGQSNREIAGTLGMAVGTVNRHVHHVLEKLATRDRHGAVAEARRHGLI